MWRRVALVPQQAHNGDMIRRLSWLGALGTLSVALLAGCAPTDAQGMWRLSAGHDASGEFPTDLLNTTSADSAGVVTITINGTSLGGHACNSFGGTITAWGSAVTITPGAMTEMWCEEPAGLMDLESRVFLDLGAVTERQITGDTMTFIGPTTELVFHRVDTDATRQY